MAEIHVVWSILNPGLVSFLPLLWQGVWENPRGNTHVFFILQTHAPKSGCRSQIAIDTHMNLWDRRFKAPRMHVAMQVQVHQVTRTKCETGLGELHRLRDGARRGAGDGRRDIRNNTR